jgi:cytochrome bd-type quinol oxidase subunit 2
MFIHPLLRLVATQPELLADHFEAYAALVGEELGKTARSWTRRLLLNGIALCLIGIFLTLCGVAVMLWAVTPASNLHSSWVLIVVPAVPVAVALLCLLMGRSDGSAELTELKRQVAADLTVLREVSPPEGRP